MSPIDKINTNEALFIELGSSVKKARLKAKLTQQQLGDAVGLTNEWICKIEGGKAGSISITSLQKIAHALNRDFKFTFQKLKAERVSDDYSLNDNS